MNEKSNGFVTEIVNNENKLKEQIEKLQAQLDSARELIKSESDKARFEGIIKYHLEEWLDGNK